MKITIVLSAKEKKQWKKERNVARFYAGSGRAGLSCNGNPSGADSSLGVAVVKKIYEILKGLEKC